MGKLNAWHLFAIFFIGFLVIGGVKGCSERDDTIRNEVIRTAVKDSKIFGRKVDQTERFVAVYRYQGKALVEYDLDTCDPGPPSWDPPSEFGFSDYYRLVPVDTLGGVFAVYSVKDVVDEVANAGKHSAIKRLVAVGLGAISGYALGRWVTSARPPQGDGPEVLKILDKPEAWKEIIRKVLGDKVRSIQLTGPGCPRATSLINIKLPDLLQLAELEQAIGKAATKRLMTEQVRAARAAEALRKFTGEPTAMNSSRVGALFRYYARMQSILTKYPHVVKPGWRWANGMPVDLDLRTRPKVQPGTQIPEPLTLPWPQTRPGLQEAPSGQRNKDTRGPF